MTPRYSTALYLCIMGMELCCLYVILVWVRESFGLGYVSLAVILATYPAILFLRLLLSGPATSRYRAAMAAVGIGSISAIVIFALLSGPTYDSALGRDVTGLGLAFQIILMLVVGWLAFSLSHGPHDYRHTVRRFQIGVLVLLVGSMLARQVFIPVVIFFALSLFTLAQSRWQHSQERTGIILQRPPQIKVLLGCLAVVIPVVLLFYAMTPGVAQGIVDGISSVGERLDQSLGQPSTPTPSDVPRWRLSCDMPPPEEDIWLPEEAPSPAPPEYRVVPRWLIVLSSLLALAALVLLVVRIRQSGGGTDSGATVVPLATGKVKVNLGRELLSWLGQVWRWIWHRLRWLWDGFETPALETPPAEAGLSSVRKYYRQLLLWTAARGLPKTPEQTPLEYCAALSTANPAWAQALSLITEYYCRARYGKEPLSTPHVTAVEAAWQEIRALPVPLPLEDTWAEPPIRECE